MKVYNFSSRSRRREALSQSRVCAGRLGPLNADGLATMIPFEEIFSVESLEEAIQIIEAKGGPAPGLDGIRVSDLSKRDQWAICRQLSGILRAGAFVPSLPRLVGIAHRHVFDVLIARADAREASRGHFAAGGGGPLHSPRNDIDDVLGKDDTQQRELIHRTTEGCRKRRGTC